MIKNITLPGIVGLLMLITPLFTANGQASDDITESWLLSNYFDVVYGPDERLVTGPFYYGAARGSILGHPYYTSEEWKTGAIEIGDVRFEELSLKYDISINQVVMKYETSDNATFLIGLRSGNITKLYIGSKIFIPLPMVKDSVAVPFAELMADGEIKYLVVRDKYLVLTNGAGMADYTYKENMKQYLFIDNKLIPFRGRSLLFKLYPELKVELKQHVRKNRLLLSIKQLDGRASLVEQCNALLITPNE